MLKTVSNYIGGVSESHDKKEESCVDTCESKSNSIVLEATESERKRLNELLSASQIIKNVIRTRMEICKKNKIGVVSQVAKRIFKLSK